MPDISALRGIRYDLGHVGSLSNVIAPPYDVIDAELQQRLYDKHPANVVRLILNKDEPGDDEHDNRYTRAARLMRSWLRDGDSLSRGQSGDLRLSPGVPRRRHRAHASRLYVPRAARAVRRREHLPARRNARRREGRPAEAVERVQGEPEPDFQPVSRSGEPCPKHSGVGDRGRGAARSDRSPGRRPSHLAGDRRRRRSRP